MISPHTFVSTKEKTFHSVKLDQLKEISLKFDRNEKDKKERRRRSCCPKTVSLGVSWYIVSRSSAGTTLEFCHTEPFC